MILALTLPFLGMLLWAAACDIARMEIPNRISVLLALSYPPIALLAGIPPVEIGMSLLLGLASLAIGYVLFNFGVFGGGDAKVLAAAAIWTGLAGLGPFLYATCIAGGALSALLIIARRVVQPAPSRPAFINRLLDRNTGAPYAVAIAIGGLIVAPKLPVLGA